MYAVDDRVKEVLFGKFPNLFNPVKSSWVVGNADFPIHHFNRVHFGENTAYLWTIHVSVNG